MKEKENKESISIEIDNESTILKKLKLKQKSLFKQASTLGIIALGVIGFGAYASFSEWVEFPIFQAAIGAGGILLAIAFRPVQQCKKQIDIHEKKLRELESLLKKNNLE
ncbi:hypothetical protein [uncultured Kordia sp.]|uniref:hypothetical protein n=1 Tax=uncultured Kordia sp. TaxID=507699 RepID=UPI00261106D0|nr:hypothetical protein [uncultured Kordia sp.]